MFGQFLSELKRRNVIRVAALYTVTAWAIFQVAKTIFETLEFPKWTSALVLVLLALGLPITMIIAWAFERAPDGTVTRTEAPDGEAPKARLNRMDLILVGGFVAVLGLSAAQMGGLFGDRATVFGRGAPEKSVAVLPFATFSALPDSEYFADGLTEEVINSLAQVPELKVAGRTSAFYFKGKNEDLREVGRKLGVAHVVEGSVRRDGDNLRVTAQLISVKDGFHLWSKTYDRKMDDAFAIQTEIGVAVAEALKVSLAKPRKGAPNRRDPQAYQLQLTARAHLRNRSKEDLETARASYTRLMALEPENADALAGYAQTTMILAQNHLALDFAEARRVSEAALDKAVKLDPNSAQVWLARSYLHRVLALRLGGVRYDREIEADLARALRIEPRNPEALTHMATYLSEHGRPAEAVASAQKAVDIDPLNQISRMVLAQSLQRVGRMEEAERQFRALTDLHPDFQEGQYKLGMLLVEQGRLADAEPWMKASVEGGEDPYPTFVLSWLYLNLGLMDEADQVITAIKVEPGKSLGEAGRFANKGDWQGQLEFGRAKAARHKDEPFWPAVIFQGAAMTGRFDESYAALKSYRPDLMSPEPGVAVADPNSPLLGAYVIEKLGDRQQAIRIYNRVLVVTEPAPGQRLPNDLRVPRAIAYAGKGDKARALAELEAAYAGGWRTAFLFDFNCWIDEVPHFAGMRDEPRLKALVARMKQDLAKQRAVLLARRK
ncbi:tetratricopeptide repeat protein [Phenylobacterium sp. LH3H17]|uniref:tetratricopeptide repeat protein n=1 Tax=Phenylobacterium sp. LH3H17 TaxID=2903901 RepID=UPI0020CA0FFF|nr:tetratricopeptide repeat protein [Phenylobacterium sp. LH3H17]UTP39502.1 tetratricopeptide repeat protein [Phenylobacterium sp. LH3H17]